MRSFVLHIISLTLFILIFSLSSARSGEILKPGDILDSENWFLAQDLLPPEILDFYKKGEYSNVVAEWPEGTFRFGQAFLTGTQANRGRFIVDEKGTIIDKETGRQPPYIYGFPFPDIDPGDPQAGVKILWNNYYEYWYLGNHHIIIDLHWLSRTGVERGVRVDNYFLYYNGPPRSYLPPSNPHNLLYQTLNTVLSPADLQGTTSLVWRYRDAEKRDSVWVFVPALRRVRQVSPSNRSDGFLGSDMSQDDGPFFDGKPEDFTWKLIGEREGLMFADPQSLKGTATRRALPGGGWRTLWPNITAMGFQDPSWKGVPWAPVAPVLVKRRFWVIEGVPRDRYYLYGRIQLYVDKEVSQAAWNRKFDWKGELINTYQIMNYSNGPPIETPDGVDYLWGSSMVYRCAYNVKMDRATGVTKADVEDAPDDRHIPLEPSLFDYQTLLRFGK